MRARRSLTAAALLATLILALGYSALSSSSYMDVSQLSKLESRFQATVKGYLEPLGYGGYTLVIGNESYLLEARGSYGIASGPMGEALAVFILASGGHEVLVVAPLDFLGSAPPGAASGGEVVVSGVYDPSLRAVLLRGFEAREYPLFMADRVLKGCHSSYASGAGRIGG